MSSFYALLRLSIVNHFSLTAMRIKYLRNRQRLWEPIVIVIAIASLAFSISAGVYFLARSIITTAPPGQSDMGLTLPILCSQVIALLMGLFTLISLFYFSNDLEILVPLPLKEKAILASKFALANITEYLPALFIVIPSLVAYHRFIPFTASGWLSAVVVFMLLPVLPLSLVGILVVTVMRGLNRRHRDILVVIASLILLAGILYIQYAFQSAVMKSVDIEEVLQNRVDLVRLLGSAFPPSVWATRAISRAGEVEGLLNMAYLLIASGIGLWVFLAVGQRVFYGGLIGGAEHERKSVAFTNQVLAKRATATPVGKALFLREWKLFLRVPIWVLNGFIAVLIVPLLAFFPAFTGGQGLSELVTWARGTPMGLIVTTLVFGGMIASLSILNTLASTSLSREGKYLWISRVLPISAKAQVMAKVKHAALAALIIAVLITGLYHVVIAPGLAYLVAALALGLAASAAPQLLGLLFDLWRPFLTWSNPQHAVKNNLNSVFPAIILLPLGFGTYFAYDKFASIIGGTAFLLVLIAAYALLAAASLAAVLSKADDFYSRLEL